MQAINYLVCIATIAAGLLAQQRQAYAVRVKACDIRAKTICQVMVYTPKLGEDENLSVLSFPETVDGVYSVQDSIPFAVERYPHQVTVVAKPGRDSETSSC